MFFCHAHSWLLLWHFCQPLQESERRIDLAASSARAASARRVKIIIRRNWNRPKRAKLFIPPEVHLLLPSSPIHGPHLNVLEPCLPLYPMFH